MQLFIIFLICNLLFFVITIWVIRLPSPAISTHSVWWWLSNTWWHRRSWLYPCLWPCKRTCACNQQVGDKSYLLFFVITIWVIRLPSPAISTHSIKIKFCLKAKLVVCKCWVSIALCNISRTARSDLRAKAKYADKIEIACGVECGFSKAAENDYLKMLSGCDLDNHCVNACRTIYGMIAMCMTIKHTFILNF